MKLKNLGQPHDEVLMITDSRYENYKANEERIILNDGQLFRKFIGETSNVKYYQILIPKQTVIEVLRSLHGEFGKHPGISETIIAHREKAYFPKMAQLITEWVMSSEQCIRESRIHRSLTLPHSKTQLRTLLRPKMPYKLIWCRKYRHLVAMKTR